MDFRRPDGQTGFRISWRRGFDRMDGLLLAARLILAAVFAVSGISKLFDLSGSQAAMRSFGVPERFTRAGGIALPIAELVIAGLLGHSAGSVTSGYVHLDSALVAAADRVAGVIADALDGKPDAEIVPLREGATKASNG